MNFIRFPDGTQVPALGQGTWMMAEQEDDALNELTTRLESGLPTLALPLLAVPTLTRGEILLLVSQGLTQPSNGWTVVESLVTQLFGAARAQQLAAVWPLPPATK